MVTFYVDPLQTSQNILDLVRVAVTSQISRLELGLQLAQQRLGLKVK